MTPPRNTDDTLEEILDELFAIPYPEQNMGLLPDEEDLADSMRKDANLAAERRREEAKALLIAWKDAAVLEAYDKGWEDCEKREPVSLQDAITFRQEQYGWNDSKMAAMLDLSRSHYSEFKAGKRGLPVNSIRKAYAIGVPGDVLLKAQLQAREEKRK
jgi:antitoxin component HigA of HigAB toxin-antitoxin module